jgi:hypothetical protein
LSRCTILTCQQCGPSWFEGSIFGIVIMIIIIIIVLQMYFISFITDFEFHHWQSLNVLLTPKLQAKLCDFGFAVMKMETQSTPARSTSFS